MTSPTIEEVSPASQMASTPGARWSKPLVTININIKDSDLRQERPHNWQIKCAVSTSRFLVSAKEDDQAGPGVESTGYKDSGKASENLEEISRRGVQRRQHHHLAAGAAVNSVIYQRPLFHSEPNGFTATPKSKFEIFQNHRKIALTS